ncbi:MAG: gamma carbonic anhydrase family protein, partial [Pseudomonadales bacterium]
MTIKSIGPHVVLDEPGFIHETARLHGKVYVGPEVSIWTYAVTRSELYEIRIGARSNIQDFVMIHEGNGVGTYVGEDCSITHHVTLHGCTIEDGCLIGINATVMDGAHIGRGSIVAGHA